MPSVSLGVPLSGLELQSSRLSSSASNVANLRSTPAQGDNEGFTPTRVTGVSAENGGVRAEQRPVTPPSVPVFDPTAQDADENGITARPNVSLVREATTQVEAQAAFEASLRALEAEDEQVGSLLDLTS